jgi:hypothetical protein
MTRLGSLFLLLLPLACACTSEAPNAAPVSPSSALLPVPAMAGADIDELHRARCGKCHVRVEPGGRTRDALNVALSRHRNRVHLTEAEWGALIDYLAPREPPTTTPRG